MIQLNEIKFYYYYYYYYWFGNLLVCQGGEKLTVTRRPLHPSIAAGLYCMTSPGFLPALCEKWSGFFYVHSVWLSYTWDRRLKVSSERLGNEDKAPCPRALLPGRGSNRGPPVWKSEVLKCTCHQKIFIDMWKGHILEVHCTNIQRKRFIE